MSSEKVILNDIFDAQIWAQEWLKVIKKNPSISTDEGSMIGWFANAIMVGYDYAYKEIDDNTGYKLSEQNPPTIGPEEAQIMMDQSILRLFADSHTLIVELDNGIGVMIQSAAILRIVVKEDILEVLEIHDASKF